MDKIHEEASNSDHDFGDEFLTPFGILDVTSGEVDLSLAQGPVTADFMVDRIRKYWTDQEYNKKKFLR